MGKFNSIQALEAISSACVRGDRASALQARSGASALPREGLETQPGWRAPLWDAWGPGQLLELSGTSPGKLSTLARLLVRAQAEAEPCAWVCSREESTSCARALFYPPDLARAGVDLAALAVVRVPAAAGTHGVVRASEILLRSGAFGLVVIDFSHGVPKGELAWQSRLSGLLRMHESRAVMLTPSSAHEPSLGPMVSLRIESEWRDASADSEAIAFSSNRVLLNQRVIKCKLGAALSISPDVREAPRGALRKSRAHQEERA